MENMDLSEFAKTKGQANDFAQRLSAISEAVFTANFNLESALLEEFGLKKRDKFMGLLREQKVNTESNSELKTFLGKVSENVLALPILTLNIAFEPKEKTLKALSDWFLLNNKRQVLFDINVSPEIIAGATMTFQGKYVDFSIQQKFNDVVKKVMELLFMEKANPEKNNSTPTDRGQQTAPVAQAT